jgi:hypothetical protein
MSRRTAGHDRHVRYQCEPDCAYLASGKGKPDTFLDPRQGLSGSNQGKGSSVPSASRITRSAMTRSARCRPARNTQGVSPTLSAMTEPSVSSRSSAVAVAACPDPQNAETVLLIVVRGALDESRQHFRGGWVWLRFHSNCRVIRFAFPDAQSHSSASATPWCITTRAFHRQPARSSPAIGSSAHSLT